MFWYWLKFFFENYLVQRFGLSEYDERETSRPSSVGVCFDIDTLNVSISDEMFPQLLCNTETKTLISIFQNTKFEKKRWMFNFKWILSAKVILMWQCHSVIWRCPKITNFIIKIHKKSKFSKVEIKKMFETYCQKFPSSGLRQTIFCKSKKRIFIRFDIRNWTKGKVQDLTEKRSIFTCHQVYPFQKHPICKSITNQLLL